MTGRLLSPSAVPFLDLAPSHAALKESVLAEMSELIDSGAFTNGAQVREFEDAFAAYCGTEHCVGVGSGLDALRLGLVAGGIGPGDEVIVPANTFIATFEAISQVGARPVPVDVSEDDYNLDVRAVEAAIGSSTRALLPVHLYGQMADMQALGALSERHELVVLEDACQAHGAERDGLRAGAVGLAGAFSFYPGKNLGAMGDAGALVTRDEGVAEHVVALREHGQRRKYLHETIGYTARLDTVQALFLLQKLPLLDGWNEDRRRIAQAYAEMLAGVGDLRLPPVPAGSSPVWHLYVIRTSAADSLEQFLRDAGIGVGRHYPQPPHLSTAYRTLGYEPGAFPVTEALAGQLLSLPIFPGMTDAQQEAVAAAVLEFFQRG